MLFDWYTKHLRGRGTIDIAVVRENLDTPLFPCKVWEDSGFDSAEVRYRVCVSGLRDQSCTDQFRKYIGNIAVKQVKHLIITVLNQISGFFEVRKMILGKVLQLYIATGIAACPCGTVKLEKPTASAIITHRVLHGLIFFNAGLCDLLSEPENICYIFGYFFDKSLHILFTETININTIILKPGLQLSRTVGIFKTGLINHFLSQCIMRNLIQLDGIGYNCRIHKKKLNITDAEYTRLVDENAYPDFAKDKAGYGLAQWTFWSRKEALLKFAKDKGKSIGNLQMQLDFLWKELKTGYQAVMIVLQNAENVREASDAVLLWYERPVDQSDAVQKKREGYGQGYYEKYAGSGKVPSSGEMSNADCPFLVWVTAKDLKIRKGNGTDTAWTGKYVPSGVYTVVEVKSGKGSEAGWGRLKSGAGWIALSYAKRV